MVMIQIRPQLLFRHSRHWDQYPPKDSLLRARVQSILVRIYMTIRADGKQLYSLCSSGLDTNVLSLKSICSIGFVISSGAVERQSSILPARLESFFRTSSSSPAASRVSVRKSSSLSSQPRGWILPSSDGPQAHYDQCLVVQLIISIQWLRTLWNIVRTNM